VGALLERKKKVVVLVKEKVRQRMNWPPIFTLFGVLFMSLPVAIVIFIWSYQPKWNYDQEDDPMRF